MNKKSIFVNQEEEIISIVDRILQEKSREVFLFLPRGAQIFQSNVNLKLLKRESDNANKRIIIVTEDESGQKMAEKSGFSVLSSVDDLDILDEPVENRQEVGEFAEETVFETREEIATKKSEPRSVQAASSQKTSRIIDLRSMGNLPRRATDIVQTKRDENYFQKLIEEKEKFPEPPTLVAKDKKSFLNIDLEDEAEIAVVPGKKKKKNAKGAKKSPTVFSWKKISQGHIVSREEQEWSREDNGVAEQKKRGILDYLKSSTSNQLKRESQTTAAGNTKGRWLAYLSWSFAILGLAAFLGAMYFVLPKADVALILKKEKAATSLLATADKKNTAVDVDKGKLPAKILQVEKTESKEFSATGEKEVQEKARGKITIYNEYSSSPQTLVATTRFISGDGKIFRIKNSITIPGAAIEDGKISPRSVEAEVEADEPGESYNIGPSDFTIPGFKGSPKYDAFYGKSNSAMTGGKIGRVNFISQEDMQRAVTEFSNRETLSLVNEIKKQAPDGYVLLDECVSKQQVEDKTTAKVGDLTGSFRLDFVLSIKALTFPESAMKELALRKLEKVKPRVNSQLREESLLIEYQKVEPDFDNGKINFSLNLQGDFIVPVDVDVIKTDLTGKNISQVENYFSNRPEIQQSEIKLWPIFARSIPEDPGRINISVN